MMIAITDSCRKPITIFTSSVGADWHISPEISTSIYEETGEGHLSLADDIPVAIFVYAMARRIEGAS